MTTMDNTTTPSDQNLTMQSNPPEIGWTKDEKNAIAAAMVEAFEMQRTYGETLNVKIRGRAWQRKLGSKFSVNQILQALEQYTDRNPDFPTPSDLNNILDPLPAEISKTEYIEAKKWLEKNGHNEFSDQYEIVKTYEKQQRKKRNPELNTQNAGLMQLSHESIRKL